jgi:agmatine deiminase
MLKLFVTCIAANGCASWCKTTACEAVREVCWSGLEWTSTRLISSRFPPTASGLGTLAPSLSRELAGRSELAITNWKFNGWAKYSNWRRDNAIPARIARALKLKQWEPHWEVEKTPYRVVLEGGSIDVNGKGTLMTTEECLLSPIQARNPKLSRKDMEGVFAEYLGIRKVLWLQNGIAGDDTHGHVDDLARFVNPTTVVVAQETHTDDGNYQPLRRNLELLKSMTDQDGKPLEIVPLPMPRPLWFQGQRLPPATPLLY